MAIPDEALKLSVDIDELTLDEVELFEPKGFTVGRFKAFMAKYSNWTAAQVGQLKVGEMRQVAEQIRAGIEAAAVPKASSPG
jgi:hypothetical protein